MTTELAEFVRLRHAALVRRAYLLVGDRAAAEDVAQETLARTCAAARRGSIHDLEAYTRRVMTNLVISGHRSARRAERPVDDLDDLDDAALVDPARTHEPAEERALHDAMWGVLQSLSPQQRSVLVLRYYEGLTEAEIAEALDVTVGTVRQHAARGLRHLRALIIPSVTTEEARSREEH
ncbi:MAG TPA: sigma-70 family RNA polymerase sigma factor [Marmoricola sp.]|nr:sigma-70 family RNA polymerase sigma factor [Marmoricola sp.]